MPAQRTFGKHFFLNKPNGSLISYFSRLSQKSNGINLAQGRPSFPPPDKLIEILKKKTDILDLHQYATGNGNFKLLNLLSEHYSDNVDLTSENLLITQGATEGIFLSFLYIVNLLKGQNFSSLSFDPVYESYPKLAEIFSINFEYFDLQQNLNIDFDKLEKFIVNKNIKIIFLASPGNPLGKIWDQNELKSVVELSIKHGFYIIFDAVYSDIYFAEKPFNPLIFNYDKLIYINSFSKSLSITGWRIGYIIADKDLIKSIRSIHDYTDLSAPNLFQSAIAEYLINFSYGEKYKKRIREKAKTSYLYLKNNLSKLNFNIPEIKGGYFIWSKLPPKFNNGYDFAVNFYKNENVGVTPGENFSPYKKQYIRINIATDIKIIKKAMIKFENFLKDY